MCRWQIGSKYRSRRYSNYRYWRFESHCAFAICGGNRPCNRFTWQGEPFDNYIPFSIGDSKIASICNVVLYWCATLEWQIVMDTWCLYSKGKVQKTSWSGDGMTSLHVACTFLEVTCQQSIWCALLSIPAFDKTFWSHIVVRCSKTVVISADQHSISCVIEFSLSLNTINNSGADECIASFAKDSFIMVLLSHFHHQRIVCCTIVQS